MATSKLGLDNSFVFSADDEIDLNRTFSTDDSDDEVTRLVELLETLEAKKEAEKLSGWVRWFTPGTPYGIENLPKHYAFFSASKLYQETYFSAANRVGKSYAGAYQTACHALGEYAPWWPGRKFDKPVDMWVVGDNKETCRDIIQKILIGDVGKIGTGMIPADRIEKVVYRPNSGGAVDYVLVKSAFGGLSRIGFKSSEQGIVSFYGTEKDVIWMDELPPADIYSECYLRTMTTNGIMYVTATPLAGLTPLVLSFYNNAEFLPKGSEIPGIVKLSREDAEERDKERLRKGEIDSIEKSSETSKAVIIAGWDDAPWLTEDAKKRMLDATPSHLKESRSKGLPSMGSGTIFTIPLEEILVKDFDIPKHWKKIAGMDVGWNNTACIWLAENPDTKEVFAYSEYKRGQAEPIVHAQAVKGRGDWIPVAIDPASRGRSQVDGKQLFNLYRDLGVKLFPADNAVESGIYALQEMLAKGRLKFFRSLSELSKEYVVYRRDQKGRVIKENDHLIDALRYCSAALKHAKQPPIPRNPSSFTGASGKTYDV
jgi:phage terminase large subunit-like protein